MRVATLQPTHLLIYLFTTKSSRLAVSHWFRSKSCKLLLRLRHNLQAVPNNQANIIFRSTFSIVLRNSPVSLNEWLPDSHLKCQSFRVLAFYLWVYIFSIFFNNFFFAQTKTEIHLCHKSSFQSKITFERQENSNKKQNHLCTLKGSD